MALIFSVQERQELQKLKDDCLHLESKQQIDYIAVDIRVWIRQALSKNVSQVLTRFCWMHKHNFSCGGGSQSLQINAFALVLSGHSLCNTFAILV